jgi:hypothetical protein
MIKTIEKLEKEVATRVILHCDLESAKKYLVNAKLSLADKDIRLFELQNYVKPVHKPSLVLLPAGTVRSGTSASKLLPEVPKRPVLIAHVRGNNCLPIKEIKNDKIDKLFDLDGDG